MVRMIYGMPHSPHDEFDHAVLDMIERSSSGSVPRTPTYDEAIKRLLGSRQIYHSSDHRDGYVTARSLSSLACYVPAGLEGLVAAGGDASGVEQPNAVYDRYVAALPAPQRQKAESLRLSIAGKAVHHRPKTGGTLVRDPLHLLFLVPGAGPQPGLPGNYLRGMLDEVPSVAGATLWRIRVMDTDTDASEWTTADLGEAVARVGEVVACAPFHLDELAALGFELR